MEITGDLKDLAAGLAIKAGFPTAHAVKSKFEPQPGTLKDIARSAGAATVVWGEFLPGNEVVLHAIEVAPSADGALWDGHRVILEGHRDEAEHS